MNRHVFGLNDVIADAFTQSQSELAVNGLNLVDRVMQDIEREGEIEIIRIYGQTRPQESCDPTKEIHLENGRDATRDAFFRIANDLDSSGSITITELDLLRDVIIDVCGVLLFRRPKESSYNPSEDTPSSSLPSSSFSPSLRTLSVLESPNFVYTTTSEGVMCSLALSVREGDAILLHGGAGAGKCE